MLARGAGAISAEAEAAALGTATSHPAPFCIRCDGGHVRR